MTFNRTRWSVLVNFVFCATALAQAHLPGGSSNYKTNSFATVVARESVNTQADLQLIEVLESGKEVTGSVQASTVANDCVLGGKQYKIEIVGGDKKLRVVLGGNSNVDLYIRRGAPVAVEDGKIVSDFKSVSERSVEGIGLPLHGSGPLQQGSYFIAISNCTTAAVNYMMNAAITSPPDVAILDLSPFNVMVGSIPAPAPGNCGISSTQYRLSEGFSTCGGGTSWDVTIRADQNVNVVIRKDKPVAVENGVLMYDRTSENQVKVHHLNNFQQTPGSGTFFIAVLNCGFEPVNFTVSSIQGVGDPAPFVILKVTLKKKKLHVAGISLHGATVLIDGEPQKTIDGGQDEDLVPLDVVIVKNAKKKLPRDQTVIISATRIGSCDSNGFAFTRH